MDNDRSDCVKVLEYWDECNYPQMDIEIEFWRPFTTAIVSVRHPLEIGFGGWAVGVGIAKCNSDDSFNSLEGQNIAKKRAFRFIADDPESREIVFGIMADIADSYGE